ncbi:MAG: argininosuccinate lyase [Limnochordia bacterium]
MAKPPTAKLWGGRFAKPTEKLVDEFTASIGFDHKLAKEDITGSLAHVQMRADCGILAPEDAEKIREGLQEILKQVEEGKITWDISQEDIHMNIEKLLHDTIGPTAGKLHTARSRNDQVATDMHLYLKGKVQELVQLLDQVQRSILDQAAAHVHTLVPGYTHLQRAQPISFAHHLLAYFWMFQRDKERFTESLKRIDISPLGACALAGTAFPIDRHLTARLLGFAAVYPNSIDAVSDRDFIVEFLSNSAMLMMHISRLAEELVIWSSQEFQLVELDDAYCTGSSIMPQKKNPDVPELLRGKTGRVYGNLIAMLTVLKGLPLAYNKDLQEDKEGMFDTADTVTRSLRILAPLLATMKVNTSAMLQAVAEDYANATDAADYLTNKGMPFREAHETVGRLIRHAISSNKYLSQLSLEEYRQFSPLFDTDIYQALDPQAVVARRTSYAGTSPEEVRKQIELARKKCVT